MAENGIKTNGEAFILGLMVMVSIDGSLEEEEIHILQKIKKENEDVFEGAFTYFKKNSIKKCIDDVLNVARNFDQSQKYCFIANVIDIATADGKFKDSEKGLAMDFIRSIGVMDEITKNILESISYKNKIYEIFGENFNE